MSITGRTGRVVAHQREVPQFRTQAFAWENDVLIADARPQSANGIGSAERRLMAAVLHEAVRDATLAGDRHNPHAHRLREAARDYLNSPDRRWLFSAENICDAIGLDLSRIRRGVRDHEGPVRRRSTSA